MEDDTGTVGTDAGQSQAPAAASVMGEQKTADERKASMGRTVSNELARGWRVESQSDYQTVLVKGQRTSHGLHLFLTIITAGLWGFVWLAMVLMHRDRREIATVDEYGNTSVSKV